MIFEDGELPTEPDDAERCRARELGLDGMANLDRTIQSSAVTSWRKVARVVVDALHAGGFSRGDHALICLHVRRVIALVENGSLEAQGDLRRPRWSEVRLPANRSDSN